MRPLPTERQLTDLFGALGALEAGPLERRLRAAITRDKTGSNIPDGYPRGSGVGGNGSGPRRTVGEDENGPEESVEFTSVELAIMDREQTPKDHHRELTRGALSDLETIVHAADRLRSKLERIDNLISEPDESEPGCWAMGRIKSWEPIHVRTQVEDKFYDLGRWAYDFTRRTGRLPTVEECRLHKAGKHVRVTIEGQVVNVG